MGWIVIITFLSAIAYFCPLLASAIRTTSLSDGFSHILANSWATSALVDYATGLILSVPFIFHASGGGFIGSLLAVSLIFLGNPVLLIFACYRIVISENLVSAFTPLARKSRHSPKPFSTKLLGGISCVVGLVYFAVLFKALCEQSIPEGWAYITSDDWSYVSFVDNMLGIIFSLVYIALRERNKGILRLIAWLAAVTLLGNGVTCIYVFMLSQENLSVKEMFLCCDRNKRPLRLNSIHEESESD